MNIKPALMKERMKRELHLIKVLVSSIRKLAAFSGFDLFKRDSTEIVNNVQVLFFISWTPCGLVCMISLLYDENLFGEKFITVSVLMSKSSFIWPALLNIFGDTLIFDKAKKLFKPEEKIELI